MGLRLARVPGGHGPSVKIGATYVHKPTISGSTAPPRQPRMHEQHGAARHLRHQRIRLLISTSVDRYARLERLRQRAGGGGEGIRLQLLPGDDGWFAGFEIRGRRRHLRPEFAATYPSSDGADLGTDINTVERRDGHRPKQPQPLRLGATSSRATTGDARWHRRSVLCGSGRLHRRRSQHARGTWLTRRCPDAATLDQTRIVAARRRRMRRGR